MKKYIREVWVDGGLFGKCFVAFMLFIPVSLVWSIYTGIQEEMDWQKFMVDHKCRKVGHIKETFHLGNAVGIAGNGQIASMITTTSTPEINSYLCDDGITYSR